MPSGKFYLKQEKQTKNWEILCTHNFTLTNFIFNKTIYMKKILLLLLVFSLSLSACKKETETSTTNINTNPAPKTYKVKYTMVCTDCEVVYVSDTLGTQSTAFHQNSTWSYTFNAKKNQELLFFLDFLIVYLHINLYLHL